MAAMADHLNNGVLAKLEPFLLMSKSAKGAAATKLIQDVTSAPGVFIFAELLDMPNIQELSKSDQYRQWFSLLQLFSFGTYEDYVAHHINYPTLSHTQTTKLKYLSLATLAKDSRILPYTRLQQALGINAIRDLEDLIIDAMYQEVVRGKLDQLHSMFEIEWSMGRDLRTRDLQDILGALESWSQATNTVLQALDKKIESIRTQEKAHDKMMEDHERVLHDNLREVNERSRGSGKSVRKDKDRQLSGQGSTRDELMDVDEFIEAGGREGSSLEATKGKKKATSDSPSKTVRKRNRGT